MSRASAAAGKDKLHRPMGKGVASFFHIILPKSQVNTRGIASVECFGCLEACLLTCASIIVRFDRFVSLELCVLKVHLENVPRSIVQRVPEMGILK